MYGVTIHPRRKPIGYTPAVRVRYGTSPRYIQTILGQYMAWPQSEEAYQAAAELAFELALRVSHCMWRLRSRSDHQHHHSTSRCISLWRLLKWYWDPCLRTIRKYLAYEHGLSRSHQSFKHYIVDIEQLLHASTLFSNQGRGWSGASSCTMA